MSDPKSRLVFQVLSLRDSSAEAKEAEGAEPPPVTISPSTREWLLKILRRRVLIQFRGLTHYLNHFRGGNRFSPSLQRNISQTLMAVSEWRLDISDSRDPTKLSQLEMQLRVALLELEGVEKRGEMERLIEEMKQDVTQWREAGRPVQILFSNGPTTLFAPTGDPNCIEKLSSLRELISFSDILENPRPETVRNWTQKVRMKWEELNQAVIFDCRLYFARRLTILNELLEYRELLQAEPQNLYSPAEQRDHESWSDQFPERITPGNAPALAAELGERIEALVAQRRRKGAGKSQAGLGERLFEGLKRCFSAPGESFEPIHGEDQPSLFRGKFGDGQAIDFDLAQEGRLILMWVGPNGGVFPRVEDLGRKLLLKEGIEISHLLSGL